MSQFTRTLADEADTLEFGQMLAARILAGLTIYLNGELGAGKTTLARGILRGLGYQGKVKSPTFTLVEVYSLPAFELFHFDFYRFTNPNELAQAGFRDHFTPQSVCLIEWPCKAIGLPEADLIIQLNVQDQGRIAILHAPSELGKSCLPY